MSSEPLSLALIAALVVACVLGACSERPTPRFPHRLHLTGLDCGRPGQPQCLSCNSCHSVSERDRAHKLPQDELCKGCHQNDAHEVLPVLRVVPERPYGKIAFDHDQHLGMGGIQGQCVPCHSGVVKAGAANLPPMSACLGCHEHQTEWQRNECTPCHAQKDLERTPPQTFLRHDGSFFRHHGDVAAGQGPLCQTCHSEAQCQSCHDLTQNMMVETRRPEAIEADFVHRGDFMVRHAIEAQARPSTCASCHTPESCDACHVERGVSGNRLDARNPHPPGWVGTDVSSSSFHGRAARRDILLCAGCHDQGPATNCIRCHKVGAYGGNPHPGGWQSTQSLDAQMCRYCHG